MTKDELTERCDLLSARLEATIAKMLPHMRPTDGTSHIVAVRMTAVLEHPDRSQSLVNMVGGVNMEAVDRLDNGTDFKNGVMDNPDERKVYTVPNIRQQ